MLQTVGVKEINDLFASIPASKRCASPLALPEALSEVDLRNTLRDLSRKNAHGEDWISFLGGGAYSHYIPSAVPALTSRGEFLTSYTPYQPEVAQGTLQAIYEYQTMVAEILGLEIANASNYDVSTGVAEAVLMALRVTEKKRVFVARSLHPEYREVLQTYLKNQDAEIREIPFTPEGTLDRDFLKKEVNQDAACVVAGYPNFFGVVEDLSDVAALIHQHEGLFITATSEALSLGIFQSPGEMGADIAVAEGQSLGVPISFGGPFLGFFATKRAFIRNLPGRLVGETVDKSGQRGFVLTLATREQHIRRERATSNICTNVSLCALSSAITMALWGKEGYRELSDLNFQLSETAKTRLGKISGIKLKFSGTTFNEFVLRSERPPPQILEQLQSQKILGGIALGRWYPELKDSWLFCITEMNQQDHLDKYVEALQGILT